MLFTIVAIDSVYTVAGAIGDGWQLARIYLSAKRCWGPYSDYRSRWLRRQGLPCIYVIMDLP